MYLFYAIFVSFITIITTQNDGPIVKSAFGYVRGKTQQMANGDDIDFFKGVPFANKPERLMRATLVDRWPHIKNVTSYSPKCIPNIRPEPNATSEFSEDCLYLNILTPTNRSETEKLPVLVFIHGGGFQFGDANDAPNEAWALNWATRGVVVVTIQYRVAALGYMSLGCSSKVLPCNIGMWDQYVAFQFINRTIDAFGGDHRNMTLMGHSAGSMSVSMHSMSPVTSKYFLNYIELSGSSWRMTVSEPFTTATTIKILNKLNCNYTTNEELRECFGLKSLDALYSAQIDTHLWPEFGDELFPNIPDQSLNITKGQNLLTGIMTLESLYFTYLKSSPEIFPFVKRDTVDDYINTTIAMAYGDNAYNAYNLTTSFYVSPDESDSNYPYFMNQRVLIDSNINFDIPMIREVKAKLQYSPNIYVYHFSYFNPAEFDEKFPVKATYHCHEFPYLWNEYKDKYYVLDQNDQKVRAFLLEAFINFIKTGNPSTSKFTWPKSDQNLKHVVIQPEPAVRTNLLASEYKFWDNMRETFNYDFITGLPYKPVTRSSPYAFSLTLFIFILMLVYILHN